MSRTSLLTLFLIILSYSYSFSQRKGLKQLSYTVVSNDPSKDSKNLHIGVYGGFIRPSFYNTSGGYGFTITYQFLNLISIKAEYLDSKYFSKMDLTDSYKNIEETSADELITPTRIEFTAALTLFKRTSTGKHYFYLRKRGRKVYYAVVKGLEVTHLYKIRASGILSNNLMRNYESDVKGFDINDDTKKIVNVSALGSQITKQTIALGFGVTIMDNATINLKKYGERSTKKIDHFYTDLLYSPTIILSNVIITDFFQQVTEYNINSNTEKQHLGFRIGYLRQSSKTIGYVLGFEIGMQPGIKTEKSYQNIYGVIKFGMELSFKLF